MFIISTLIAKIVNKFIRTFTKGGGFTWPGHVVLKIFPGILSHRRIHYPRGIILVSGTNGKTTTVKLLSHLSESFGLRVTSNRSGANLLNGILTSILLDTNLWGKPQGHIGIFEVDEFTLPSLLKYITPDSLLLLNLSRDQLDRYGETDVIWDRWLKSFSELPSKVEIIADKSQAEFSGINKVFKGRVYFFDDSQQYLEKTQLTGKFNAKNVNAAFMTMYLLGYRQDILEQSLGGFSVAYGRGETVQFSGKKYQIYLAKNPASFNHNLEMISAGHAEGEALLFVLNDNIPDGRDVSWIYDIDPGKLNSACEGKTILVSGTRALDMAIRLSYAGISAESLKIEPSLADMIRELSDRGISGDIIVLPNYSAMLETREILTGRKIL